MLANIKDVQKAEIASGKYHERTVLNAYTKFQAEDQIAKKKTKPKKEKQSVMERENFMQKVVGKPKLNADDKFMAKIEEAENDI